MRTTPPPRTLGWRIALLAGVLGALPPTPRLQARDLEYTFAVPEPFQELAARGGNPRPATGRMKLALPENFDPSRVWPLLIVISTSDLGRDSTMDVDLSGMATRTEGWVVLGTDATIRPKVDSSAWRFAMIAAGLEALRQRWPTAVKWPVALAGLSGGANRCAYLAPVLAKTGGVRLVGVFLTGINEDTLSPAVHLQRPPDSFFDVPIYLSSGWTDRTATPNHHAQVESSMLKTGFRRVRLEQFNADHVIKLSQLREALRWFRRVGQF